MFTIKLITSTQGSCYEQLFMARDGIHILNPGDATFEKMVAEDPYILHTGIDVRSIIIYDDADKKECHLVMTKGRKAYIINENGQTVSRA